MEVFYRIGDVSHKYKWFHFIDRPSAAVIWTVGSKLTSVEDFVFDITHFSLKDLTQCGAVLRDIGIDASTMEECTNRSVRYLHDHLT